MLLSGYEAQIKQVRHLRRSRPGARHTRDVNNTVEETDWLVDWH